MASSIALVFSKVVDPKNPLYLDDYCCETVDWGFGLLSQKKEIAAASHNNETIDKELKFSLSTKEKKCASSKKKKDMKYQTVHDGTVISDFRLVDPDEVIDPATLNSEHIWDEEEQDDESRHSETSNDSSLQPYDLSDDDTDLQKKFSQLGEIAAALCKPDDPDGVSS